MKHVWMLKGAARSLAAMFLLCMAARSSSAQVVVDVDLALAPDTNQSALVGDRASVQFRLVNRIAVDYSIAVRREVLPIAPFAAVAGLGLAGAPDCPELIELSDGLPNLDEETDVRDRVVEIRSRMGACNAEARETLNKRLAETAKLVGGSFEVRAGEQLVATITRLRPSVKRWTVTVTAGERGQWLTTYGVGLIQNGDQRFYAKAAGASKFIVTNENSADMGLKPIPSLFFSWLPASRAVGNWSFSPSGGVGVKSDKPMVFLGGSILYNWNLGLTAGIAVGPESRRSGRYEPGQELAQTVGDEELNRSIYRARPMVAIVFRFGSNPFSSGTDAAAAAPKKAEATAKKAEDKPTK